MWPGRITAVTVRLKYLQLTHFLWPVLSEILTSFSLVQDPAKLQTSITVCPHTIVYHSLVPYSQIWACEDTFGQNSISEIQIFSSCLACHCRNANWFPTVYPSPLKTWVSNSNAGDNYKNFLLFFSLSLSSLFTRLTIHVYLNSLVLRPS